MRNLTLSAVVATGGFGANVTIYNTGENFNGTVATAGTANPHDTTYRVSPAGCAPSEQTIPVSQIRAVAPSHRNTRTECENNWARTGNRPRCLSATGRFNGAGFLRTFVCGSGPRKGGGSLMIETMTKVLVNGKVGVFFGGTSGLMLYQGLAPGLAGLYQLNVQIPSDAPTGDVLLDVEAGGNSLTCIGYQATIPIVKSN
jgi:uncharacterized protein (TIGR03437 family)